MKKVFLLLSIAFTMYACTDDEPEGESPKNVSFDRGALLANLTDNIIIPAYEDFVGQVEDLETAANAFTASPEESTLTTLQDAWLTTYTTWQRVSVFEIGPAESVGLRLNVNIYPADVTQINENISNGAYDLSLPSNRTSKGFPAMDYLLFGEDSDEAVITAFENSTNRQQYLNDIVTDMNNLSTQVRDEWQEGFRDTFVDNDGSSSTASVDRIVNDYIFYYERFLRAGKMGIPGGVFSGTPAPQNIEAFYNGTISKQLFLEGLGAVQDFFNGVAYNGGAQGESLSDYLDALNTVKDGADLSTIINNQFEEARTAVQSLGTFTQELENNPPIAFLEAYNEVQRIVPLIKVDMVSALSISIDFADADGD